MNRSFKPLLPFTILVLVAACDKSTKSSADKVSSDQELVVQDLDKFEARVRIAAINKRIDELERKVGKLEATPEKLDLDLLSQRVTTLEVKASDASASNAERLSPGDRTSDGSLKGIVARKGPATQRATARSTALKLPHPEERTRLATPAEAKAFSPGN